MTKLITFQNRYIQKFFKRYSKDKDKVDKLIGVHLGENVSATYLCKSLTLSFRVICQ